MHVQWLNKGQPYNWIMRARDSPLQQMTFSFLANLFTQLDSHYGLVWIDIVSSFSHVQVKKSQYLHSQIADTARVHASCMAMGYCKGPKIVLHVHTL